jgi:hypothetical protein
MFSESSSLYILSGLYAKWQPADNFLSFHLFSGNNGHLHNQKCFMLVIIDKKSFQYNNTVIVIQFPLM